MTTEEKFNAAVNVIRSLPKNGKQWNVFVYLVELFACLCLFTSVHLLYSNLGNPKIFSVTIASVFDLCNYLINFIELGIRIM